MRTHIRALLPLLLCPLAASAQDILAGVVKETTNTSSYTYARIETGQGERWLAGPRTLLRPGDRIETAPAIHMKDFPSPSLRRTFPDIWFVGAIRPAGAPAAGAPGPALPPGHPPLPAAGAPEHPHARASMPEVADPDRPVGRLDGGLTVAEIHQRSAQLAGSTVRLHARVVKVNRGVLDRTWVHLRDGSGEAESRDLTVTTTGNATPGEEVDVEGRVAVGRDFGAGYRYAVMLEDATLRPTPGPR